MTPNESDIAYILESERNWSRFQRFSTDLLGQAFNLNLVSNELGSDLGRDAQWFHPQTGDIDGVVCAAVRKTAVAAVAKFHQDFKRLVQTGLGNHVLMTSNVAVTEEEVATFKEWCRRETTERPRVEVYALGRLATISRNHLDVFDKYYGADVLSLRHRLLGPDDESSKRLNGLRIALATQFNPDGAALRDSLIDACVAVSLSGTRDWMSLHELCVRVGQQLQLPNAVVPELIRAGVDRLATENVVTLIGNNVRIEAAGIAYLRERDTHSTARARKVREGFCKEVLRRLSADVVEQVEDRLPEIWVRLQEMVVDAFWHRSLSVCNRVLDLSDHELLPEVFGVDELDPAIADLLGRSLSPDLTRTLTVAVLDTVVDRTGIVRSTLQDTAAKFVALCSIGIHPEAYEEINARLRKWMMLLDTHVLVSWLCSGEPDHQPIEALLASWKKLNREIAVPQPVLEETAYHAWLSNEESQGLRGDRGQAISWEDYDSQTAFVRTFLGEEKGHFSPGRWDSYIRRYLGREKTDGTAVRSELESMGVTIVVYADPSAPPRAGAGAEVRPTIRVSSSGEIETELKHVWDSQLIALALQSKREREKEGGGVVILSQSSALHAAMDSRLPQERVSVKSSASVGFAMAMLPGSSLSFAHLRELLFDDHPFLALSGEMKSLAARIVRNNYDDGLDRLGHRQLCETLALRIRDAFSAS